MRKGSLINNALMALMPTVTRNGVVKRESNTFSY